MAADPRLEQDIDVPDDPSAFGVALDDGEVDRDDAAVGHLGPVELSVEPDDERTEGDDKGAHDLGGSDPLEPSIDGAETAAAVLLEADGSPDLEVSLSLSEVDEDLDGGEEGPQGDESRTDISTTQVMDEDPDDDDASWKAFSDSRPIAERPWRVVAEREVPTATLSESRIAVPASGAFEAAHSSSMHPTLEVASFEEAFGGLVTLSSSGIRVEGKVWLPFAATSLAKLDDDTLVVATFHGGTTHVYAGRVSEPPFLVFTLDREDGETEVRDIVETETGVRLRGAFGEVDLERV